MLRRVLVGLLIALLLAAMAAPLTATADHGEGHNGETMEVSKTDDITHGEEITVTLSSFLPEASITVVTCFLYPAAGPTDCELSNYGQHTAIAGADGTATLTYPVAHVDGKCDVANQCYIVAGDGIGPDANYAAVEVSFAAEAAAEEPEPEPTAEPEPEPTAVLEPTAAPEPEPEPEVVAADEPIAEADDSDTTETAGASDAGDDDDGGSSALVWIIPLVAVLGIGGAGAAYFAKRGGESS